MQEEQITNSLLASYPNLDTTGFNIWDLIHAKGSALDALMYSKLFWPDFVEIEGMVLLKDHLAGEYGRKRVSEVNKQNKGDLTRTEKSFNYIEVFYISGSRGGESTVEQDLWLAELLCEMWAARLKLLYPDRSFAVEALDESHEGGELYIGFYQRR